MKKCTQCEAQKPFGEFHKDAGKKDGRQTVCKECCLGQEQEKRDFQFSKKLGQSCFSCGYNSHPTALCWIHIDPSTRKFQVSSPSNRSFESILKEIAKCNLECYNCYRFRTNKKDTDWSLVLAEFKQAPCLDCGLEYHHRSMEFDHRPGETKLSNVSKMRDSPNEALLEEIAKCDLVCANCHQVRTYDRRKETRTI